MFDFKFGAIDSIGRSVCLSIKSVCLSVCLPFLLPTFLPSQSRWILAWACLLPYSCLIPLSPISLTGPDRTGGCRRLLRFAAFPAWTSSCCCCVLESWSVVVIVVCFADVGDGREKSVAILARFSAQSAENVKVLFIGKILFMLVAWYVLKLYTVLAVL